MVGVIQRTTGYPEFALGGEGTLGVVVQFVLHRYLQIARTNQHASAAVVQAACLDVQVLSR